MKRVCVILLLLVTLAGWLQVAYGKETTCCCSESCACHAQAASSGCPCDCGKEKKQLEELPPLTAEWPDALIVPNVRTPLPAVLHRLSLPAGYSPADSMAALWHAPPGIPPAAVHSSPAVMPYIGFPTPLRA